MTANEFNSRRIEIMPRRLRLSALIGLLSALLLSAGVGGAEEGTRGYEPINPPVPTATGDKVEVVEVFWYGCGHCWHLEPTMTSWAGTAPAGVAFRRVPATGPRWDPHARAYYAAEALGKLDQFHPALFKAMQVDHRPLMREDDLVKFAGEIGIDEQAFRDAYHSFTVEAKVRKAQDLNNRYGITGVPAIIVDGKYRTGPSVTGGLDSFVVVLNELVNKELAAKAPAAATSATAPAH
jgi:protein dithiol oxidoreductase (disulfide-forming)